MCAVAVCLTGLLVLVGWTFDLGVLKSILPQWVTMKLLTALAFILSGMSLWVIAKRAQGETLLSQVLLPILSVTIVLIMATLLFSALMSAPLGIEDLGVKERHFTKSVKSGLPSLGTMIAFILFAWAGMATAFSTRKVEKRVKTLGWMVGGLGGVGVLGYLLNADLLYYYLPGVSGAMAVHTAALFVLLGAGLILAARPLGLGAAASVSRVEVKIGYGLSLSLVALLVIGTVSLLNNSKVVVATGVLESSLYGRYALSRLDYQLKDAEANQRGFLVTGDDSFLTSYRDLLPAIFSTSRELQAWAADDPNISKKAEALAALVAQRIDRLDAGIGLRQTQGLEVASRYLQTGQGRLIVEAIRQAKEALDQEERLRSEQHEQVTAEAVRTSNAVLFLGVSLAFILVTLAGYWDIGERHRSERQAREGEEKFRTIADYTYDWEYWRAPDGGMLWVSPACERLTGYSAREFQDDPGLFQKIVLPEDAPLLHDHLESVENAPSKSGDMELRIVKRSGEIVWVQHDCVSISAPDGTNLGQRACNRDITARKLSEMALAASEEKFSKAFFNVPVLFTLSRLDDGRYLEVNDHFVQVSGFSREEVLGRTSIELGWLLPEERDRLLKRLREQGHVVGMELRVWAKDGRPVDCLYHGEIIETREGRQLLSLALDISERKRMEESLKAAKEAAEAASRAKSEFLANMSHEIRTPLNGILGMLQIIKQSALAPDLAEYLSLAAQSGQRLTRLLSDILDLSSIEAEKVAIVERVFSPAAVLKSVQDIFLALGREKGLPLRAALDPATPRYLVGDELRLTQILTNLVGNAFKYTVQGEVSVDLAVQPGPRAPGCRLLLTVRDTGIGIPADKIEAIFESFTQADSSKTRSHQGAGLGLSIVKRLVELMGGGITVDSMVGRGTTFFCTVGCRLPEAGELAPSPAKDPAKDPASVSGLTILLAEDDAMNQMSTKRLLEYGGHAILAVSDGQEALEALARRDFDLILMDIQMPNMDGLEATRRIRASGGRHVPIVAMTAYAMVGDRERFLEAGMDDYIAKPVDLDELNQVLARVMASRAKGL